MSTLNRRKTGTKIIIEAEIDWKVCFDAASKEWIGVCNHLGLTASDTTYSDLVKAINEATDMMFADLLKSGDLDEFLSLRNWTKKEVSSGDTEDQVEAPYNLITRHDDNPQASALQFLFAKLCCVLLKLRHGIAVLWRP